MKRQSESVQPRLIPLASWNQYHAWPPQGGLRHLKFNQDSNGFAGAFVKCGRRVLIDEARFFEALNRRNELIGCGGHG